MNEFRKQGPARRAIAAAWAATLVVSPVTLRAGDLNTEVNNMFNSLGTIGNYTEPGAFRGHRMGDTRKGEAFSRRLAREPACDALASNAGGTAPSQRMLVPCP